MLNTFCSNSINVGELIANNIYTFASGSKKALANLSIICWLCEEAECDLFVNDLSAPMMKPLNDTTWILL